MRDLLNGSRKEKTFDRQLQIFSGSIPKMLRERKKNGEWEHSAKPTSIALCDKHCLFLCPLVYMI